MIIRLVTVWNIIKTEKQKEIPIFVVRDTMWLMSIHPFL